MCLQIINNFYAMRYLGIDVAKDILCASFGSGAVSFPNTSTGIQSFILHQQLHHDPVEALCESTGDYHLLLCKEFLAAQIPLRLSNPLLTKRAIRSTVRNKKTDTSDAELLASMAQQHVGTLVTVDTIQQVKKTTLRLQQQLVGMAADLKRMQHALKQKAQVMDVTKLQLVLSNLTASIEEQTDKLMEEATKQQNRQEEILDSIPGCGKALAAIISAEAGDVRRFDAAKQLKAYVGIDPVIRQSGNACFRGRITKRGNRFLRKALFLAACIARIHDPELKVYYEKKRAEGKSYRHVIVIIIRKLCERIFSLIKHDRLYVKRTPLTI